MKKFLSIFFRFIKYIAPLKKEYVIFQCHNPKLYCDNTRFLFEYLNKRGFKNCYWNTSSKIISEYLKNIIAICMWRKMKLF